MLSLVQFILLVAIVIKGMLESPHLKFLDKHKMNSVITAKMTLAPTPGHTYRNCVIGGVTSPEAEATDYLSIIFLEVNSFWCTLQSLTLALPGNLPSLGFICHRYAYIHCVVVICNTWGKCRWDASDPKLHIYQRPSSGHSNTLLSLWVTLPETLTQHPPIISD